MDHIGEKSLEVGTVIGGIAQDMHGVGLDLQQVGQVGADHRVCMEFVEGRIDFKIGLRTEPRQGRSGGVLLAIEFATEAAVEAHAELRQVIAQRFGLAITQGGEHVIVFCAERRLTMSDQVDTAHAAAPAGTVFSRG